VLIDALALFVICKRFLPHGKPPVVRITVILAASLIVFVVAAQVHGIIFKGVFLLLTLVVFVPVTWLVVFSPEERRLVQEWL
jgi:uncharacterized membrane protein